MKNNNKEWENYKLSYGKRYIDSPWSYNLDIQFIGKYLDGYTFDIGSGFNQDEPECIAYQVYLLCSGQYLVYYNHENPTPNIWNITGFEVFETFDEFECSNLPQLLIYRVKNIRQQ